MERRLLIRVITYKKTAVCGIGTFNIVRQSTCSLYVHVRKIKAQALPEMTAEVFKKQTR